MVGIIRGWLGWPLSQPVSIFRTRVRSLTKQNGFRPYNTAPRWRYLGKTHRLWHLSGRDWIKCSSPRIPRGNDWMEFIRLKYEPPDTTPIDPRVSTSPTECSANAASRFSGSLWYGSERRGTNQRLLWKTALFTTIIASVLVEHVFQYPRCGNCGDRVQSMTEDLAMFRSDNRLVNTLIHDNMVPL